MENDHQKQKYAIMVSLEENRTNLTEKNYDFRAMFALELLVDMNNTHTGELNCHKFLVYIMSISVNFSYFNKISHEVNLVCVCLT